MSIVFLVLPLALLIVAVAVAAFVWATRRGQYDDLVTPAMRMLADDDTPGPARLTGRRAPVPDEGKPAP